MILLDTNVISELMRPKPDPPRPSPLTGWTTPEQLQQSREALVAELFSGRIWPFSSEAAHWYAEVLR